MTILDKFFILFESDADDAAKDIKKLDKSLDDVEQSSKGAVDIANTLSASMESLSEESKAAAADLAKLAKEEVVESKQLDGLDALSKDLKKLSKTEALEVGKKIGLNEKQITTLRKGKDGVKQLSKELKNVKSPADSASKQFSMMGKKALGAVGGVFALASAVGGMISTAGRIDELVKFSDLIGENIEDVDAWGGAVVRAGGSASGFQGSIKSLNEKMVDASVKGFNEITPFFNQLGVSIVDVNGKVKSTIDILPELAESFERMDKKQSLGIGQKLGLDSGTIALLQQGTDSIDKLIERQKKLGLANAEAGQISAEFNDIMADFKQVANASAQSLLITLVPAVTWTIDKLINFSMWVKENKPIVYGFFAGLAVVAIPALLSLAAAGWVAIAPFLVMAAPFIAIGAAAAAAGVAIGLVVEDILAFVNGQDSLLGDIAEKWPIVGDVINAVADVISAVFDDVKVFVEMMKDYGMFLLNIFIAPEKALESLKNTLATMKDFFNFDEVITKKIDVVKSFFGFGKKDEDAEDETKKIDVVKSFFGFGKKDEDEETKKMNAAAEINKNVSIGQESINMASNNPIASQTSNSIQNSNKSMSKSTSVQTGDIIVQTQATDSKGIASDVGGSLEEQMRTTVENFDDGILI